MVNKKRPIHVIDENSSPTHDQTLVTSQDEGSLIKRARVVDIIPVNDRVIIPKKLGDRVSNLASPTMLLTGHSAAVYSIKFDPLGQHLASSSFDRSILLWNVYGECTNYNSLTGHKNAVLEVQWTYDSTQLISCSADKTIAIWDAKIGQRIKKFVGHSAVVNSCCPVTKGPTLIASGSDDGTAKLWDARYKRAVKTFDSGYPVTAVCFSSDNSQIFVGGLDGIINSWDLRNDAVSFQLHGHTDIVTCVSLSPDGQSLLSNSMDNTLRRWDVNPYVKGTRQTKVYTGAKHSFERNLIRCGWSSDMNYVTSGSADRLVYVWAADSGDLRFRLPGHNGSVNEAIFHPNEPILGSCGNDKQIFLGELTAESI